MVSIEWPDPAFAQLEALPEKLAFEIVRRVDMLATFPEMGISLKSQYPALKNCRQLIVKRSHRVIYEFEQATNTIYILAVQHCRQSLPAASELKRRREPRTDS
jgi:mRNA-degrading endonuclease RelE of RelBE toxin-antitoxin system